MLTSFDEIYERFRSHPKLIIADDYELTVQKIKRSISKFRNGEEIQAADEAKYWIGLRVLHRKQPGKSATNDISVSGMQWLVDNAFAAAEQSGVDPWFRFPLWKTPRPMPAIDSGPAEEMDSLYERLALRPEFFDEKYEDIEIETQLFRKTEKTRPSFKQKKYAGTFGMFAKAEGRSFWLREYHGQDRPLVDRIDWVERLLGLSMAFRKAVPWKNEPQTNVIMGPAVGAALLREILPWFSASEMHRGRSPFPKERDKKIFSSALTLIDDATYPGGWNSHPFDMEGTLAQKTTLVDKGVFKDLFYDSYHAAKDNRLSTGNLVRPLDSHFPEVGPTNTYFAPSDQRVEAMVKNLDRGLYLETVDAVDVPFGHREERQFFCTGWRIEKGTFVHPVYNVELYVDLRQLPRLATQTANDLIFFGELGSPSIFFENLPLSR